MSSIKWFFVLLIVPGLLIAQGSSSSSYRLIWQAIDGGGVEGTGLTSPSYRLNFCLGQSTPVGHNHLYSSSSGYRLYPGFRMIDLDLRYPYSWFITTIRYMGDSVFTLSWSGIDTTAEDGWGWGIWNYDIQYRTSPTGEWINWLTATTETTGTFTGHPGETYYFRIRARDLATNVAPWDSASQDSAIVDFKVNFSVQVAPGGDPLTSSNFIILSYYSTSREVQTLDTLWSGESATVSVIPGTEASMTIQSSGSTEIERWRAAGETPPTWTITDASPRQATYYHQYLPTIYLEGTDPTHTVSTEAHTKFGASHLDAGVHTVWSDWADKRSEVRFSEYTTGIPPYIAIDERSFTINSAITETVHYRIATVNVTVRNDFGGRVIVDGVPHDSPYTATWNYGSSHTITAYDCYYPSVDSLVRYQFDHWSDGGARSHTVVPVSDTTFTAYFNQEFRFDVASSYGSPAPAPGRYYYRNGETVSGYVNLVDEAHHMYCNGYTGTGNLEGGGSDTSFSFVITQPSSISWTWAPMVSLTVTSAYGHPNPSGTTFYVPGTTIEASVETLYYNADTTLRAHNTGWTGTGSVPAYGDSNRVSFVINTNSTINWGWTPEVRFDVFNPGGYDAPQPPVGRYWYEPGSTVSGYVTSPSGGYMCIGAHGTGSLPDTISGTSFSFVIREASSISWIWVPQPPRAYRLIVVSPYGNPMPRDTTYYPADSWITCTVEDTVYDAVDGIRHLVTGWTGTGSVPATGTGNRVRFQITEDSQLNWQWRHQYRFDVFNPAGYGTPNPPVGGHWYDDASLVYGSVDERVDTMVCIGYIGTGSLTNGSNNHFTFEIRMPSSVTWQWQSIRTVYSLIVESPYGNPVPSDTTYYTGGTIVNASVDSIFPDGVGIRRVCDGYIADGSVIPPYGTNAHITFAINMNTTITWLWHTEYRINLTFAGPPSASQTGAGFYQSGSIANISSQQVVEAGGIHYVFHHWSSNPPGAVFGDSMRYATTVVVDTTYTLTAHYTSGVRVTIRKNPLENWGGIIFDGDTTRGISQFDYWVVPSTSHSIGVTSPDSLMGTRYIFTSWSDGGAQVHTVTVLRDTTFVANYRKEHRVIVRKNPLADTLGWIDVDRVNYPRTSSVVLWYPEGSILTVEVSTPDENPDYRYIFDRWSDGGAIAHQIGPLTAPVDLTAYYKAYYRCFVRKRPPQSYGSIIIGSNVYDRVAEKDFWARQDSSYQLGVSYYDIAPEWIYIFSTWEGGTPGDTSFVTPRITMPDTFFALYDSLHATVCFSVTSNAWHVGRNDSIDLNATSTMRADQVIRVVNDCGNITIDLGLFVADPGPYWMPGYTNGRNTFVLRARFDDEPTPPTYFSPGRDYVKMQILWADASTFGPKGFNIPPPPATDNKDNLWLQFIAPSETSTFSRQVIQMVIRAKPRLE